MTNRIDENQFELVTNLLKRQDEALEQLNQLIVQIEGAIEENTEARSLEFADDASQQSDSQPTPEPVERAA